MLTLAGKSALPLAVLVLATGGPCQGDHQGRVSPDGKRYGYERSSPNEPGSNTHLYQWSYDQDGGWGVSAHSVICTTMGLCGAVFDPAVTSAVAYDDTFDGGIYVAQDGGFAFVKQVSNLPGGSIGGGENSALMSDGESVIFGVMNSQPFLLTLQADGGYDNDAGIATTSDYGLSSAGDLLVYNDYFDGGGALARRSGGGWNSIPFPAGVNPRALSPDGKLVATCDPNGGPGGLAVAAIAADNTLTNVPLPGLANVDADCNQVRIADTGALVFVLSGTNTVDRADPPGYVAADIATNTEGLAFESFAADGGALLLRGNLLLPDGSQEINRLLYLGPLALTIVPGVALPDVVVTTNAPPGAPLLSVALRGQPTDSATVQSVSVQPSGTLGAGVTLVHLWLDVDHDGVVGPADLELGTAQVPPGDGGPLIFDSLALSVARVGDPFEYDAGAAPPDDAGLPEGAIEYLLVTAETGPDAGGTLRLALDPTQVQAATTLLGYPIHPLGAPLQGALLTLTAADAGAPDAGAPDAGSNDAGSNDAGSNDAGANDAGANDAGSNDAGSNDAGANDAGTTADAGSGSDAGSNDAGSGGSPHNSSGCGCNTRSSDGLPIAALCAVLALRLRRRDRRLA